MFDEDGLSDEEMAELCRRSRSVRRFNIHTDAATLVAIQDGQSVAADAETLAAIRSGRPGAIAIEVNADGDLHFVLHPTQ